MASNQTISKICERRNSNETWKQKIRRRLAELENGQVQAIPGRVVSNRIRQIVGR